LKQFDNAVFIVTGGASGLGEATARMLVEQRARVLLADVNEAAGSRLARELGVAASSAVVDVTDERSVQNAISLAASLGTIRGVVNAAGIVLAEKVLSKTGAHPLAEFERVIRINLIGTFNVIRLAARVMSENPPLDTGERGVIVNTASVAAFEGQIGQAAYSASKGGVVGLTLPVARELARFGIRVVTIAPGIFDTPMMASLSQAVRDSLSQQIPFPPRLGRPSEYAALVRHILENEMINGEVIRLDGAIRMGPK
jgi:NAD(P)-dependent dehydrogenase (short-subunit alcohol dehydrogenase family)